MKQNLMLKAYVWLITTIRDKGPITLSELNDEWKEDCVDEGNPLGRFKFYRYKSDIEEAFGVVMGYKKGKGYYIENPKILSQSIVKNWMLSTMSVNYAIADCMDIMDRIGVENIPSSEKFLWDIIRIMKKQHTLQICYLPYGKEKGNNYTVQPYFLKLYHQRWYLIGPSDTKPIITLALDRMKRVRDTGQKFLMDETLTVDDYLYDCYGVMKDETLEVEDILLRAYGTEVNYLRDLPLHGSQEEMERGHGWSDFRLLLRPSWDFIGKLMERGERIKVLEPSAVVEKILTKHAQSVKLYEQDEESLEV